MLKQLSLTALAVVVILAGRLSAQTEGAAAIPPVQPGTTSSSFPHHIDLDWFPDGNDPFSITGTMAAGMATPGGSGIIVASLGANDEVAFGFLPLLVDLNPVNVSSFATFGYDANGELLIPGVSRSIPALAGMSMHIQCFEVSPLLTSSNSLIFSIAP